jgi:hypothetical protein
MVSMQAIISTVPTLAVSVIYCLWYAHLRVRLAHQHRLRERVAYMLWVMAHLHG